MSDLTQLIKDTVTQDSVARKVANAAKVNKRLGEIAANVGEDDGVSVPAVPSGGSVVALNRSLAIFWNAPPLTDHVDTTDVWVGSAGGPGVGTPQYNNPVKQNSVLASPLTAGTAVQVWLRHTNIWGRSSAWVQVGTTFTPAANVLGTGDSLDLSNTTLVNSLTASKITTGTITASNITIGTGGALNAGSAELTDEGLKLNDASSAEGSFPGNAGDWITPPDAAVVPSPYAGFGFFNDTSANNSRGVLIRASGGAATTKIGQVTLSADNGDQQPNLAGTAKIILESKDSGVGTGIGDVTIRGNVTFNNDVSMDWPRRYVGTFQDSVVAPSGGSAVWTGLYSDAPTRSLHVQYKNSGQTAWRHAALGDATAQGVMTLIDNSGGGITINNNTGGSTTIKLTLYA